MKIKYGFISTSKQIKSVICLLIVSIIFSSCSSLSTERYFSVIPQSNVNTEAGGSSPCGGPSVGGFKRSIALIEGESMDMKIYPSVQHMSRINFIGPFYFSVIPVFFFGYSGKTDLLKVELEIITQRPIDVDFRQFRLQTATESLLPIEVEHGWGAEKTTIDMNQEFHMEPGKYRFIIPFNIYISRLKEFELLFDGFSSIPLNHQKIQFHQDYQTVYCVVG